MCGDNLMDKNLKKSKEVYGIIYLIRNKVNNKLYFGQTTKNFNIRYAGDIKKFTHNEHLRNSIEKYGENNFEIIEEFDIAYSREELDRLEDMYIKLYDTVNSKFGYNKRYGGINGKYLEGRSRKIICVTTGEVFDKMSYAADKYYNGNMAGIHNCCNLEYASIISSTGEKLQWLYYEDYLGGVKPLELVDHRVICITTGKVFDNAMRGAEYYNIDYSHIHRNCKKESNYCGTLEDGIKLQWLYYNDYINGAKQVEIKDDRVVCVTTGEVFANAGVAARHYHIDKSAINKVCRGVRKTCGKLSDGTPLVWKRFVDYNNESSEIVA